VKFNAPTYAVYVSSEEDARHESDTFKQCWI